ncbi:MAG: DUF5682 family protein [Deferribacteraceae bacterium]|jgi:hypothetical protein|nr:DUF5682 family protein [Deferribacteraceae bacterium]
MKALIHTQFTKAYDLSSGLVFFPLRHHSPLCSHHLLRTLEVYQPEAILIEGPSDTNHLLEHIADEANRAPIAIYYAYTDAENKRSSCYFPMLDYSPELVALRYGAAHKIPTSFIDLPYSALADHTDEDDELNNSYNNDYYIARSRYIAALCEKQNCRNYGELWEKLFELNGIALSTDNFVRNMLALCYFSRIEYPQELLEAEGCLAREAYMAAQIAKAKTEYKKILVITGGFHTGALIELIENAKPVTKHDKKADAYLIPYSYEESDQLSGYSSGMPYPAFYQRVQQNIKANPDDAFNEAVMHYLVRTGQELRAKNINISLSEETAAFVQCRGLATLRGKAQAGVYELLDGITSAYVKSELNVLSSELMRICKTVLRGTETGSVTDKVDVVPLLKDFRDSVKKFALKAGTSKQELTLEILAKPKHRQLSIFLRRLDFLGAGFADMFAGPDYKAQDSSRVRERWNYAHNAKVEARIIDVSYLGGTVHEAAANLINKRQEDLQSCAAFSELLIDVIVMDLPNFIRPLLERVRTAITEDGAFESLAKAATNLMFIEQIKWMLSVADETQFHMDILKLIYAKAASLLPYITVKDAEEDRQLAILTKSLYQVALLDGIDAAILDEALQDLSLRDDAPPYLYGCACGLLYSRNILTVADILRHANGYLAGTGDMMKLSGLWLAGLFYTAWDIIFQHDDFIKGISAVLATLDEDSFMALLPDMRLAFSTFTPANVNRIAEIVAKSLSTGEDLTEVTVSEAALRQGIALDSFAAELLQTRGLMQGSSIC